MRKKNTSYTVNKHNMVLFADIDRDRHNIFDGVPGSSSVMQNRIRNNALVIPGAESYSSGLTPVGGNVDTNVSTSRILKGEINPDWSNSLDRNLAIQNVKDGVDRSVQNMNNIVEDFNKPSLSGTLSNTLGSIGTSLAGNAFRSAGKGVARAAAHRAAASGAAGASKFGSALGASKLTSLQSAGIGAAGTLVNQGAKYLISDGYDTDAGNLVADIGGAAGTAVGYFNPVIGAIVSAGTGIIGGIINHGWGMKVDQKKKAKAEQGIAQLNNYQHSSSFDDIASAPISVNTSGVYRPGWFRDNTEQEDLDQRALEARDFALGNQSNNARNLIEDQIAGYYRNSAALGGPIVTRKQEDMKDNIFDEGGPLFPYGMPPMNSMPTTVAIDLAYNDQLRKARDAQNKDKMTNLFMGTPNSLFAIGGDMQTNSADFSTGLIHVNAGESHELNPNDGVQMGVDNDGTPNLVEEGEVIFNDYVYSARIPIDQTTKEKFHFPKKKDITYAEAAKKLEREIKERPNDPISQAGFKAQMETLASEQERQKAEMEAERAKAAFEALSPEEQTAIMQRAAQEEQMAQQAAMQQEAMAQQQPSPEEAAMLEQQMMQADGSQAMLGQEAPMMACGGKVNKFDKGGEMKKRIYKLLGINTDSEYKAWLEKNDLADLKDSDDWENILNNKAVMAAVAKDNPALSHALDNSYDFGLYQPEAGSVSFDDDRGNWDAQTVQGWWGSNDPAWQEVIKNNPKLTKDTNLSKEELADLLRNTEAFQKGTKWLQDSEDNRLTYLQRIINNPNAPKRAREYALRFANENGWKQGASRDYTSIFDNPSGRAANPGTYWKTPIEAVRGTEVGNFVINEDGSVEPIIGDVPTEWTSAGNYAWATPENDYTYNYYRRPAAPATPAAQALAEEPAENGISPDLDPVHKADWMRYAGLFGPAVGLGLQLAGVGKPDYSGLEAAAKSANGPVALAEWMPRGDFAKYQPDDPWFYTSPIIAQSNSTQRAITNKVAPSKGAETLANSYNTMIALGQAQRQQLDNNFNKYMKVKDFNGNIFESNARRFDANSQFNADARNRGRVTASQVALQAANQKMDADAGWYNSLYGNIGGLFKGISDVGVENKRDNMINWGLAKGIYGVVDPEDPYLKGRVKEKKPSAKGGKISKKHDIIL